ncbi:hypothetical protein PSYCG_08115 [Psychrobacter sp. G]|uniref:aldehyde dehydrogenase family protein n=1 Tax=Psychrobacter sp. G TaxID=571800 RepID=UPI000354D31B|nr:aldehyde dehydrogenase family protein [Psychrobacter sp. G]AGP49137.1 hypothetical protein PSYCG_08115 [Psychrobacter sp. G]
MPAIDFALLKVAIEAVDRDDEKDTYALYDPNSGVVITTTRLSTKAHVDIAVDVATQAYLLTPVDICALIVPWNFPMVTTAWKLAFALAAWYWSRVGRRWSIGLSKEQACLVTVIMLKICTQKSLQ